MATYHCTVKVGQKGRAEAHAAYIGREGQYAHLRADVVERAAGSDTTQGREARLSPSASGHADYIARQGKHAARTELEHCEHGNMPSWAKDDPTAFWQASDRFERANGSTYREIEVALPRELDRTQRLELVRAFVRQEIGHRHAYSFAIHNPRAAIAGGEQPHAHIMFSERRLDGIERGPREYFRRYNAKAPERGGCRKESYGGDREALVALRARWAGFTNRALEQCGHEARVDHRTLKEQGADRVPEKHLGPVDSRRKANILLLSEYRAATRGHEQARDEVRRIDVKTTLAQAIQEWRERRAQEPQADRSPGGGRLRSGGAEVERPEPVAPPAPETSREAPNAPPPVSRSGRLIVDQGSPKTPEPERSQERKGPERGNDHELER